MGFAELMPYVGMAKQSTTVSVLDTRSENSIITGSAFAQLVIFFFLLYLLSIFLYGLRKDDVGDVENGDKFDI